MFFKKFFFVGAQFWCWRFVFFHRSLRKTWIRDSILPKFKISKKWWKTTRISIFFENRFLGVSFSSAPPHPPFRAGFPKMILIGHELWRGGAGGLFFFQKIKTWKQSAERDLKNSDFSRWKSTFFKNNPGFIFCGVIVKSLFFCGGALTGGCGGILCDLEKFDLGSKMDPPQTSPEWSTKCVCGFPQVWAKSIFHPGVGFRKVGN